MYLYRFLLFINYWVVHRKDNGVILVFKGFRDRKVAVLVGFPYKNLNRTLAFPDCKRSEQRRTNRLLEAAKKHDFRDSLLPFKIPAHRLYYSI